MTLLEQHRMPACIASFPNQQYYHGNLVTPLHAPSAPPKGFHWPSSDAICFIDEYGPGEKKDNNSLYNSHEAQAVVDAMYWLLQAGDVVADDIVILAFYQEQVQEICKCLRQSNIRVRDVTSVDGFQGSQAPLIGISTVRCNVSGTLGFAGDARRLNVAMTRAQKGLLIFGSQWTLIAQDGHGTWTPFYKYFEAKGWIRRSRCIAPPEAMLNVRERSLTA